MLLMAPPALASTISGSGSHNGKANQTNSVVKLGGCFKSTGTYTGSGPTSGSTSVSVTDGTKTYTGSISVSWDYSFYQGPDGSFTDSTCTTYGTGASGSANTGVLKRSGDGGAGLYCSWGNGTITATG